MHKTNRLGKLGAGLMVVGVVAATMYGCSSTPTAPAVDAGQVDATPPPERCSPEGQAALTCDVLPKESLDLIVAACKESESGPCRAESRAADACYLEKKQCAGTAGAKPIAELCKAQLDALTACNARCVSLGDTCDDKTKCCGGVAGGCVEGTCCLGPGADCAKDTDCCGRRLDYACVSGKCAQKVSTPDSGAPPACYLGNDVEALSEEAPPARRPGRCSAGEIATLKVACLTGLNTPACSSAMMNNPTCTRCIFGSLPGDDPTTVPVPAILVVGPSGALLPFINTPACASVVINRPECGLPIAKDSVCVQSACRTCSAADDPACHAAARQDKCLTEGIASSACRTAIDGAKAQWEGACDATTVEATFDKVATELCGAP